MSGSIHLPSAHSNEITQEAKESNDVASKHIPQEYSELDSSQMDPAYLEGSTHLASADSNEITQEAQQTDGGNKRILQQHSELDSSQMHADSLQDEFSLMRKSNSSGSDHQKADRLIKLVSQDLEFIGEASKKINKFDVHVKDKLKQAHGELEKIKSRLKTAIEGSLDESDDPIYDEVHKFKKRVTKLKLQIPFKIKVNSNEKGGISRDNHLEGSSRGKQIYRQNKELSRIVTILFADAKFKLTSASKDFLLIFDGLDINLKLCLLCFSVFPENVIIRKRLMINWWLGEGFLIPSPGEEKSADEQGAEYFDELIQKGFIMSAHKKRTMTVNSCKMHPFVRSSLILVAKEANFFDFDPDACPMDEYSSSLRTCLTGNGVVNASNLHKVHTLFNLNEDILDFKPELFLKMKNVNVMFLGRWQASTKHHVEVDDSKILEGLIVMKHLKFLSLQGVSRIIKLPASISKLRSLTILDLRACHNLEKVPREIGSLESLTHLDMSECYLLTRMPKELSLLTSLLVLKGFIVGAGFEEETLCSLEDLAKLPELRKLGIYTNKENFPDEHDLIALSKFDHLTKLVITWGSNEAKNAEKSMVKVEGDEKTQDSTEQQRTMGTNQNLNKRLSRSNALQRTKAPGLPLGLEKLDLECYPGKSAPNWLNPDNMQNLKKLYIRGGKICLLSQEWTGEVTQRGAKWKVEALRLKYLSELRMDWRELQNLFPELVYLEKLRCPKLTLFPCDIFGIWMDSTKAQGSCNKWHPEVALMKPTIT